MGPLNGVKVLDLTTFIPGIYCTMLLADMGAEVTKIEVPGGLTGLSADMMRRLAGTRRLERNKRSIALNLRTPAGKEIFAKLAADADAILEGYRPGVTNKLGIDYAAIRKINPKIIYCSMSGFGQEGPYANLVGFDNIYGAIAGALGVIGDKNGNPVQPLNLVGDLGGGSLHAALGIVMALYGREKTGKGQYIDLAITDGIISLLAQAFSLYWYDGHLPQRGNDFESGALPEYDTYKTKDDKYITIAAILPKFWENLCKAVGHEELIPLHGAGEQTKGVKDTLQSVFFTRTRDEWFEILSRSEVAAAKIYDLSEVEQDPHVLSRGMITSIRDPETGQNIKQVGIALKMSESPGSIRTPSPKIGQHTEEILANLGYGKEDIDALRHQGAIG